MTIETYAEILQKRKRGKMSNYDMDEIEREKDRNSFASVKIGDEEPEAAVTVELPDDVVLKLALQAHERDITLNKMCGIVLKDSLKNLEYRYEHQSKPQVLKEY
jgi:hypothetical protein